MDILLDKIEIGKRLREFGISKYGNISAFAKSLGYAPSVFQGTYLNGRSLPGSPLIAKLILAGCDISWLLLGEPSNDIKNPELDILKSENDILKKRLNEIRSMAEL